MGNKASTDQELDCNFKQYHQNEVLSLTIKDYLKFDSEQYKGIKKAILTFDSSENEINLVDFRKVANSLCADLNINNLDIKVGSKLEDLSAFFIFLNEIQLNKSIKSFDLYFNKNELNKDDYQNLSDFFPKLTNLKELYLNLPFLKSVSESLICFTNLGNHKQLQILSINTNRLKIQIEDFNILINNICEALQLEELVLKTSLYAQFNQEVEGILDLIPKSLTNLKKLQLLIDYFPQNQYIKQNVDQKYKVDDKKKNDNLQILNFSILKRFDVDLEFNIEYIDFNLLQSYTNVTSLTLDLRCFFNDKIIQYFCSNLKKFKQLKKFQFSCHNRQLNFIPMIISNCRQVNALKICFHWEYKYHYYLSNEQQQSIFYAIAHITSLQYLALTFDEEITCFENQLFVKMIKQCAGLRVLDLDFTKYSIKQQGHDRTYQDRYSFRSNHKRPTRLVSQNLRNILIKQLLNLITFNQSR